MLGANKDRTSLPWVGHHGGITAAHVAINEGHTLYWDQDLHQAVVYSIESGTLTAGPYSIGCDTVWRFPYGEQLIAKFAQVETLFGAETMELFMQWIRGALSGEALSQKLIDKYAKPGDSSKCAILQGVVKQLATVVPVPYFWG